ncbi:MAG: 2-oxoglutarate dehydrogenase E1 component, partial [Rhodobacteraceae bacterium]|nr:2-oxoglutarate dehydrogenase E1 component [Paracoccaceae bacterium]
MAEKITNKDLHSTSFLSGGNAQYIELLQRKYNTNPESVDKTWRDYFNATGSKDTPNGSTPSWTKSNWPYIPRTETLSALDGQWQSEIEAFGHNIETKLRAKIASGGMMGVSEEEIHQKVLDSIRALMVIRAYRIRGHRIATLDPLGLHHHVPHSELEPHNYGFTEDDLDRPIFIDYVLGLETATMRQILELVRRTYCGTFALQYMHISDPGQSSWLKERIEGYGKEIQFTSEGRRAILHKLVEAEGLEQFFHVKYTGTKRFGIDGGEALIPAMEQIVKRGGSLGIREIVIGMPHRGRLNVLASVMGKPYRAILHEFHGGSYKPEDIEGSGDVKYHLGASSDREFDGNSVHLSLTA